MTQDRVAMNSGPQKFRKKPVEIQAMQFIGSNWKDCLDFIEADQNPEEFKDDPDPDFLYIETLEGTMEAHKGDFIIRGIQGEFYPCKPDIFAETYEQVIR